MTGRGWGLGALLLALVGGVARAQSARDLAARGREAYRALEYTAAAGLFRQSLELSGPAALDDTSRSTTLVYLGASELFAGHRDAAAAAFRAALEAAPQTRPDSLIFPPTVSSVFDAVRRTSNYVAIHAPATGRITPGQPYLIRLYTSAPLAVTVTLGPPAGGTPTRTLFEDEVADSADIPWDGIDAGGQPARGRYQLRVEARSRVAPDRGLVLPLTARATVADSLPLPTPLPDSAFFPERQPAGPAVEFLAGGLMAGVLVALVPSAVAGSSLGPAPYVAGATLGLAGLIGYITRLPGRPIASHVAANEALRAAWRRERDAVLAANAQRRSRIEIEVVAGTPAPAEP